MVKAFPLLTSAIVLVGLALPAHAKIQLGYSSAYAPGTTGCSTPASNTVYYSQFVQSCGGSSITISNSTLFNAWASDTLGTAIGCSSDSAGTLRYRDGSLELCNGSSWSAISGGGGGSTPTDRISTTSVASGDTLGMVVADQGTVSFTLGGTAGAAYMHPTLGLVGPGISASTGISTTSTGYFGGNVGTGTTVPV